MGAPPFALAQIIVARADIAPAGNLSQVEVVREGAELGLDRHGTVVGDDGFAGPAVVDGAAPVHQVRSPDQRIAFFRQEGLAGQSLGFTALDDGVEECAVDLPFLKGELNHG